MPPQSRIPLIDRLIPGGLEAYLIDARSKGESYNTISHRLAVEHNIETTPTTVSDWCGSYDIVKLKD